MAPSPTGLLADTPIITRTSSECSHDLTATTQENVPASSDQILSTPSHSRSPSEHTPTTPGTSNFKSSMKSTASRLFGHQLVEGALFTEAPADMSPPSSPTIARRSPRESGRRGPPAGKEVASGGQIQSSHSNASSIGDQRPIRTYSVLNLSPGEPAPPWLFDRPTILTGVSSATQIIIPPAANIPGDRNADDFEKVWVIYAKVAGQHDQQLIDSWNRNLDVRLIFAGIFSAILTPFIVESYRLLDRKGAPPKLFGPNGFIVRVNAAWFGSLMISLISALLSIHIKQWLDGYGADQMFTGGSPEQSLQLTCRLRQFRYQGLLRFRIPEIISLLPVLLYLALLLFAIGLVDFLWHLSRGIAIWITCLCGVVVIFHLITTIIPFFTASSPFKTPLSNLLGNLWRGVQQRRRPSHLLEKEEMNDVTNAGDDLDCKGLEWLKKNTRDESIKQLVVRAELERQKRCIARGSSVRAVTV